MKIISASIDLSKINKSKIKTHDKDGNPYKNGAKYYEITIMLNSEPNQFGQHASIQENQTKEEREAQTPKVYLGNGKIVFSNSSDGTKTTPEKTVEAAGNTYPKDDLPF